LRANGSAIEQRFAAERLGVAASVSEKLIQRRDRTVFAAPTKLTTFAVFRQAEAEAETELREYQTDDELLWLPRPAPAGEDPETADTYLALQTNLPPGATTPEVLKLCLAYARLSTRIGRVKRPEEYKEYISVLRQIQDGIRRAIVIATMKRQDAAKGHVKRIVADRLRTYNEDTVRAAQDQYDEETAAIDEKLASVEAVAHEAEGVLAKVPPWRVMQSKRTEPSE
jgi:hypothetical protein